MLKENAGTPNEGRRDTKANVEAADKTRIEDETRDQDQRRRRLNSGYGLVRGAHMSRVRVELGVIRGRGRSSNHIGDDGGTQTGI